MRKSLFLCTIMALCLAAFGQKKDYIGLSVISAFPVGDFAKAEKEYVSDTYGYAKRGVGVDLSYVHRSSQSPFGFAAALRVRQNKIDTANVLSENKAYNPYNPSPVTFAWKKKEVKWGLQSLLVGGYYGKAVSPKATLQAKVLTGVARATLPGINWTATAKEPFAGYAEFKRDKGTSITVSTCVAAGVEYGLTKKLSLVADAGYWYAKPTFRNIDQSYLESYGNSGVGGSGKMVYAVDMSTVDITVGLAWSL